VTLARFGDLLETRDNYNRRLVMKRRDFVRSVGGGGALVGVAVATSSFPAPAIAQGIKQFKMVTTWPKNFPGLGTGAERLAERITIMTGGQIEVKVFAAGELVPAFESFDAVSSGNAEMSHSVSYYWQGKSPAFNFFAAVPFGLTANEHAAWIVYGGGQELWDEVSAPFAIKPFLRASTGIQMGGWFRREINTLDDFKGLKFRMPGLGGEVMRRLGAAVVNLPGGEIFPALQSGTIDGTEWVGPWHDLAFGFYKVAPYYYWPGWHEPGTTGEVMINLQAWEGLTGEQQAIFQAAIAAEAWQEFADFSAHNADSLKVLIDEHDVQLRRFSDELLGQIGQAAEEVVAEVGNSDAMTTQVYESYLVFREKSVGWGRLSDQGYLAARALLFT
jgi:TRAP-type mannitol/chloroaromatic compound transport system substrate-binding protein